MYKEGGIVSLFLCALLLLLAVLIGLLFLRSRWPQGRARLGLVAAFLVILLCSGYLMVASTVQTLAPGEMGFAYQLLGGQKELNVGYNFVAPWNRIYRWDMRAYTMNFSEGGESDDAFGAQTRNGDYLTAIANITVRIDPDRLAAYITRFGNESISGNQKIYLVLKNELKRAMETALMAYDTKELMGNKAKASTEASDIAKTYLAEMPFVVETLWFVDFQASAEYEAAIGEQADLRMRTDKAVLQESLNRQEAQNNKAKADGEAVVLQTAAKAEADANEIRANSAAAVAIIQAQNEAAIAKLAAERDAQVKIVQAEADAEVIAKRAQADAAARVARDEAEAQGAAAIGKTYLEHPQLLELKRLELQAAWAERWNGMMPQFQGMEAFNFVDLTEILQSVLPQVSAPQQAELNQ